MNRFWILWNPSSDKPPAIQYNDRNEAMRVATVMAKKYPGQEFFVLCATSLVVAEANPVKVTHLTIPGQREAYNRVKYGPYGGLPGSDY